MLLLRIVPNMVVEPTLVKLQLNNSEIWIWNGLFSAIQKEELILRRTIKILLKKLRSPFITTLKSSTVSGKLSKKENRTKPSK